jgi:hypothetical protein
LPYEIDFLRAGESNGDAIIVKWGDTKDSSFYLNVIDGGRHWRPDLAAISSWMAVSRQPYWYGELAPK